MPPNYSSLPAVEEIVSRVLQPQPEEWEPEEPFVFLPLDFDGHVERYENVYGIDEEYFTPLLTRAISNIACDEV